MRAVRAAWLRGGTSKGLYFQAKDIPSPGPRLDALVLGAIGSPDASGIQLNGVGGGISSTSKVAVISPSKVPGYDVDYLFGQVEIKDRHISWSGSCGNLSAGVGLFALAEGLVKPNFGANGVQNIRVWQVNQQYGMSVHVPWNVDAPMPPLNDFPDVPLMSLAGVPGKEPPVYVELEKPCGEKPLLPTGNVTDKLKMPDGSSVEVTLVTAGNPTVFVRATDCGLKGPELPAEMDYSKILPLVEHLRVEASPLLGVQQPSDQPRVAFLAPPDAYVSSSGEEIGAAESHLLSRISTPGRIHHAHTGTGSIALACAAHIKDSIAYQCIPDESRPTVDQALKIGHPGGVMEVKGNVALEDGVWKALGAGFERTSRYLMRGELFVPFEGRAP